MLDLPEGMPSEILSHLKKVWVSGQQLRIHRVGEDSGHAPPRRQQRPEGRPPGKLGGGFAKKARDGAPKPHRKGKPAPRRD